MQSIILSQASIIKSFPSYALICINIARKWEKLHFAVILFIKITENRECCQNASVDICAKYYIYNKSKMKHTLTLRFAIAFTAILLSLSLNAAVAGTPATDSGELKLNQTIAYSTPVVQVSFNGNDGETGFFQVLDASGVVIRQIETVELIKSPSYFTIDISEFHEGTYTFLIKTKTKTYTSNITIK